MWSMASERLTNALEYFHYLFHIQDAFAGFKILFFYGKDRFHTKKHGKWIVQFDIRRQ